MMVWELIRAIGILFIGAVLAFVAALSGSSTELTQEQTVTATSQEETTEVPAPEKVSPAPPPPPPPSVTDNHPPLAPKATETISSAPPAEPPPPSFTELNERTRKAVVNIMCMALPGTGLPSITGSGVIIDSRGVILTNAHIGQYLLLRNYPSDDAVQCTARVGSPAIPTYRVELLYLSSDWIDANAKTLIETNPLGTGENDYAFLRITGRTDPTQPLPSVFPFVTPDTTDETIKVDAPVLVAGYPAGFLGGITIERDLYLTSSTALIEEFYTFAETTLDLFSLGGSVVAQRGASGGAVVGQTGKLIGIIVTSTDAATTGERDLRAITLSHIDRSLIGETGGGIDLLLFGDLAIKARVFNLTEAPALARRLIDAVER